MHAPRPYGRFAEQAELSPEDAAAVEQLARHVANFKTLSDLDSLKRVRDLPSGRQAYAVDAGGILRVMVSEKYEAPTYRFDGVATTNIPMLFSGVVKRSMLAQNEYTKIKLTQQTKRRIVSYDEELSADIPDEVELKRFSIEYGAAFKYFLPETTGDFTFTQYMEQRPTWYSGAMSAVVQLVGGYGSQNMNDLPDSQIERATLRVPEKYMRVMRAELGDVRLPGYTGFPNREGQFQYEYTHRRCHLVSFDDEDNPWLIQVFDVGVWAMPLPMIPVTTTQAFRDFMEEVGDDEILQALDKFKGLPSGESFPLSQDDFYAWERAGVFIKVCESSAFYSGNEALYSACGWSVNSDGTEGFNTCWNYDDDRLLHVHGYKLKLSMNSVENRGMLRNNWQFENEEDRTKLNQYLSSLYAQLGANNARELAIKYKIRNSSLDDLLMRAGGDGADDVDYWENLKADPIAEHTGSISRTTSGPVYWPGKVRESNWMFKVPVLNGEGCESFDLRSVEYKGEGVRSDTVLFGCYVQDSLRTIKYFYDPREYKQEDQSTFEECMIVGSWEKTSTTSPTGLLGHIYTNDFDDRTAAPASHSTLKITGTDLGYGNPAYHTPPILERVGSLSRARYYMHRNENSSTEGFGLQVSSLVPVHARDCILYAYEERTTSKVDSMSTQMGAVSDPTSYELWTDDPIFHFMGFTGNMCKGEPPPHNGDKVYVDTMNYAPGSCSDFADSGDWFGLGGSFKDVSGLCAPYTSRASNNHQAGGAMIGGEAPGFEPESSITEAENTQEGKVQIAINVANAVTVHSKVPNSWYFGVSPIVNIYFYRDAVWNALGKAEFSSTSESSDPKRRMLWGNSSIIDRDKNEQLIGVINE